MKKWNWKLTLCLVSLFVSLILIIFGNSNKYCLAVGLICLGVSIGLYAFYRLKIYDDNIKDVTEELTNADIDDEEIIIGFREELKKLKKERLSLRLSFFICAILLVILGIISLV